jgi:quercetin dioxygenase-like cupin family protein
MRVIKLWRAEFLLVLLCLVGRSLEAQEPAVHHLMTKDVAGAADKEVLMVAVEYGPGVSEAVHRHNAQAFVYVLEGSVVMQVKGGTPVTLHAGDTFYEGPDDIHLVGRNASSTERARFVVVLIKKKGAPVALPAR